MNMTVEEERLSNFPLVWYLGQTDPFLHEEKKKKNKMSTHATIPYAFTSFILASGQFDPHLHTHNTDNIMLL